jgi:hypothetical protein
MPDAPTDARQTIDYRHRPVRADGAPELGIRPDVVCERCLTLWPCRAQLRAAAKAADELARYQRRHPHPYSHAAELAATAALAQYFARADA